MRERPDLKVVSDEQLLRDLFEVLHKTRHDEADLVAHIGEVDARKLYARQASPSMFAWCTERLHLSEAEAYLRIGAARATRRHPMLLAMLADGRLHLSAIERLAPHLTHENRDAILRRAIHKTKREIEELVAELAPRPAAATRVRKLPARRASGAPTSSAPGSELRPDGAAVPDGAPSATRGLRLDGAAATVLPPDGVSRSAGELRPDGAESPLACPAKPTRAPEAIAPDRFRLQFDLDVEFRAELERLQALTRSAVPDGDLGKVVRLAVRRELERLEAQRFGRTKKPRARLGETDTRPKSRHIPAAVRRFVHERDGGRCTYRDKHRRRCTKRHDLEFHHVKPFGLGGDHSPEGLALMCRTHNALLAEQDFGKEKMARHRRDGSRGSGAVLITGAASSGAPARCRSSGRQ